MILKGKSLIDIEKFAANYAWGFTTHTAIGHLDFGVILQICLYVVAVVTLNIVATIHLFN